MKPHPCRGRGAARHGLLLAILFACAGPVHAVPVVVNVDHPTLAERAPAREQAGPERERLPMDEAVGLRGFLAEAAGAGHSAQPGGLTPGSSLPLADSGEGRQVLRFQGRSLRDLARAMINVQKSAADAGGAGAAYGYEAEQAGAEVDPAATEEPSAVPDAMADAVSVLLRPRIDEHGVVSFSLAGLGEFTLVASGDRHQLSLGYDDLILFNLSDAYGATGAQNAAGGRGWRATGWAVSASREAPRSPGIGSQSYALSDLLSLFTEIVTYPPLVAGALALVGLWGLRKILRLRHN